MRKLPSVVVCSVFYTLYLTFKHWNQAHKKHIQLQLIVGVTSHNLKLLKTAMTLECWQVTACYHGPSMAMLPHGYERWSKVLGPVSSGNSRPILSPPCPALLCSAGGAGFTRAHPDSSLRTPHCGPCSFGVVSLNGLPSFKKARLPRFPSFPRFPVSFLVHVQYPKPMPKVTRMSLFVLPVIKESFQDVLWVIQASYQLSLKLL